MTRQRLATSLADWAAAMARERSARCEQAVAAGVGQEQANRPLVIDHLVIGSGYGGAVAALRLAEAGHAVVLLERGSEYLPGEFPNDIALLPKYLRLPSPRGPGSWGSANGLFEWHQGGQVSALTANGLGGGSLINAGVVFEPDDDVRRQSSWPAALRVESEDAPGIDSPDGRSEPARSDHASTLASAMRVARRMLGAQTWPQKDPAPKTLALKRSAAFLQAGAQAHEVELTIDPAECTRCGDCATGCNVAGAKLTLRDTYLARAQAAGATLVCGAWVWRIEPRAECAGSGEGIGTIDALPVSEWRWCVTVFATDRVGRLGTPAQMAQTGEAHRLLARHVVVAAGTFGSTELLQRSQALAGTDRFALSPALGSRFSGNGDALSFVADMPERVGAEGHGALKPAAAAPRVGPTITAVADLRRHTEPGQPPAGTRRGLLKPIEERLVVEDGATPGAIVRATREMLALVYTLGEMEHFRARTPRAAAAMDPLGATAMGEHTQVLLAMGHDGSAGHIVRLPEYDRSVPYWPGDLAALPTYRAQQRAFDGLADLGAVHLHPPTWQLLPPSAGSMMSGPKAPRAMLTVHPLGGCPMGDDFEHGVVDHRGRVRRSPGRLWPGLCVLDGSIVPSALGVNPLLTITALAERAMAHALPELKPSLLPPLPVVPVLGSAPEAHRPAAPEAFSRREAPRFDVSVFERLTCRSGQLSGQAALHAEAKFELASPDWMHVWDDPRHRVSLRTGTLRLQSPAGAQGATPEQSLRYRAIDGHFELLPRGDGAMQSSANPPRARRRSAAAWRAALRRVADLGETAWLVATRLPLFITWYALRGQDDRARAKAAAQPLERPLQRLPALAKGMAHAAEQRQMRYRVRMERVGIDGGDGQRGDTNPRTLLLVGRKDVRYGASLLTLWRWHRNTREARRRGHGVPPPRPTYWEQITNPELVLIDGALPRWRQWLAERWPSLGAWAWGRFELDAAHLLAQTPMALHRGDLTSGIEAQSAYALHFLRHALKTHLSDFRAPDYSGQAVRERRGLAEVIELGSGVRVEPRRHRLAVRRGRSEGEEAGELGKADEWPAQLPLDLWHYICPESVRQGPLLRPGRWYGRPVWHARSVLLLHAFGQSGAMFTQAQPHPSLARTLLEQGFDVWVLDHRISTRGETTEWPSTIDQIARFDIPQAVATILDQLRPALKQQDPDAWARGEPMQLFAFGQCIGGAALAMSLLDGRLSHGIEAALTPGEDGGAGGLPDAGVVPVMPQLAGAVISQTHPFLVAMPTPRAKTWLPQLLQTLFGWRTVPLAVRGPVDSICDAWIDRLFASLPVPPDEHCPHERNAALPQDDCATCRRIRFFEAPLFKHANLSAGMHRLLPQLFGPANLHLFAHAARCVEHERLTDNDGRGAYVRDDRWRHHMGLPLAFLHGQDNELFHVGSARRSAAEHARLWPDQVRRLVTALGRQAMPVTEGAWELPGFGHVDPVLGERAPALVFMPMARLFDALWRSEGTATAPAASIACALAMPRQGPWIGHVQAAGPGRLRVHLAFHLDDRSSAGQAGPGGSPGTRTWAFVRVQAGTREAGHSLHRLAIADFHARDERVPNPPPQASAAQRIAELAGWRVAHGAIEVECPGIGEDLHLHAFSVHEMLLGHDDSGTGATTPDGLLADPDGRLVGGDLSALDRWLGTLLQRHEAEVHRAARRRDWLDPAWRQVARQAGERLDALAHRGRIPAAVIAALPSDDSDAVEFAAASCRYPGMAVDGGRVDEAARTLLACAEAPQAGRPQPFFAMLLGDQIYADASAGLVDPLNAVERFVERHRGAFAQGRSDALGRRPDALGDLLARVPTYLTQDDHELRDGWPGSGPLQDGLKPGRARENRLRRIALDALTGFQRLQMPPRIGSGGSYAFDQGLLRVFVLDARTERCVGDQSQTLGQPTWDALDLWWSQADRHRGRLHCLVSGSVLLPRLAPGSNPADPGEDTLSWRPQDRRRLLAQLQTAARSGHCLLVLSGDYHVSAALQLMHQGRKAGAVVVAPALYAPLPYTNATPESLYANEDLRDHELATLPITTWNGSGFVSLRAERRSGRDGVDGQGFRLTLRHWLRDHAQADAAGRFSEPLTIDLEESGA